MSEVRTVLVRVPSVTVAVKSARLSTLSMVHCATTPMVPAGMVYVLSIFVPPTVDVSPSAIDTLELCPLVTGGSVTDFQRRRRGSSLPAKRPT
ncbi:hypothetical protein D3C81_1755660 [compost metagenome]